jgi:hypothetical protein
MEKVTFLFLENRREYTKVIDIDEKLIKSGDYFAITRMDGLD